MNDADKFLKYDYAETKDLLKSFITLISGTLVVSITFSEKVIGFAQASEMSRNALFLGWGLLVASLILAGASLVLIAAAAGKILYGALPFVDLNYWTFAIMAWACGVLGGMTFVAAFAALAWAAGGRLSA